MRILLIQPPKSIKTIGGEDIFIYEPLSLEYLAAGVSAEHDVMIMDLRLDHDLDHALAEFGPDVVGITAYTVHVGVVKSLCKKIKTWDPRILTVVGGHHATVMPEDFVDRFIDVVVTGEGVFVFREIVRRREKKEALLNIPGTIVRRDGSVLHTPSDAMPELDSFPFPVRSLTAKYRSRYFSEWMKPLASIRTSKGCPYRCTFCAEWKVAGGKYFKRKPERIVEELGQIAEPFVFFADDESLIDAGRMAELARLIHLSGIKKRYFLYGRSDTISNNPGLLETWRRIGLDRVFVGLESNQDRDLRLIRKGSTTTDNARAIEILHALDIEIYASFIVRPEFTREEFSSYPDYCRRMGLNYASFAVLTPLPGTDLYEETKDILLTHDHDFFDFIHTILPTTLPLTEFYAELCDLYQHAIPLRRQLALLRRYPLKDIPGLLGTGRRFFKRLRTAHLDYEQKTITRERSFPV